MSMEKVRQKKQRANSTELKFHTDNRKIWKNVYLVIRLFYQQTVNPSFSNKIQT